MGILCEDAAMPSPLEQAVDHYRAGRLPEAARAFVAILQRDPEHADALQLLALVMNRMGHPAQALGLLERALKHDKRNPAMLANRAMILRALDRPADAAAAARKALRLRPDFPEALCTLSAALFDTGDHDGALAAAEKAHGLAPGARSAVLIGWVRIARNDLDGAAAVLADVPLDPESQALRGRVHLARGEPEAAARDAAEALVAQPTERSHATLLADALTQIDGAAPGLEPALLAAFALSGVDHGRLDPAVQALLGPLDDDAVLAHPLFAPWLGRSLVTSGVWAARLPALRDRLIDRARAGEAVDVGAAEALALQAFYAEHPWPAARVDDLGDGPVAVALRAAVAPWDGPVDAEALPELARVLVDEPARERELAATLPSLTDDADSSVAVREMYEDNPYPRLVTFPMREPRTLADRLAELGASDRGVDGPADVLIAGCGTGQHALITAGSLSHRSILAIDLSTASLARAQRLALEHGFDRLRFARADLLGLHTLEERFDLVESVGVLHHLADPLAGWRVLRGLLRPGGVMRIGLYSERGRADVVAARALIAEHGWPPTPDGIRAARDHLLGLPADHPAKPLVRSPDFPSESGLRDLIFHVCEHRITPLQLADQLAALDLELLGFQHPHASIPARFEAAFGPDAPKTDLALWDQHEQDHPQIFSGMLVFWCAPV